jgi:hypothetical protein
VIPSTDNRRVGRLMFLVVLVAVVLPVLLYSSQEYRAAPLFWGCLVAGSFAWPLLAERLAGRAGAARWMAGGLLLAQLASFAGALLTGADGWEAARMGLEGLVGVLGLAVLVSILSKAAWPRRLGAVALGFVLLILLGSYVGYFIGIDRYIELGNNRAYFDTFRISLIWPTRLLMAGRGQLAWENTIYAGFHFALAAVLLLECLGRTRPARAWRWWLLVAMLLAAVFLTGSRAAWLMVAGCMPLLLLRRPWRFAGQTLMALVVAVALGWVGLEVKIGMTETSRKNPGERHLSGLLSRGSAGRLDGYAPLWRELEGARLAGHGLAATGKPVGELLHEHSSLLATVRGGGLAAALGHLVVLAAAGWGAWQQLLGGRRWPAILLVAVLAAITFDRTNVFRLTGNIEFIGHWVAVLAAVVLAPPALAAGARPPLRPNKSLAVNAKVLAKKRPGRPGR